MNSILKSIVFAQLVILFLIVNRGFSELSEAKPKPIFTRISLNSVGILQLLDATSEGRVMCGVGLRHKSKIIDN
jgi:hypothetical protein